MGSEPPLTDEQVGAGLVARQPVAVRRTAEQQECVNSSGWLLSDPGPAVAAAAAAATSPSPIVNIPARL